MKRVKRTHQQKDRLKKKWTEREKDRLECPTLMLLWTHNVIY